MPETENGYPAWADSNREQSLPVCDLTDLPRLMCSCREHDGWVFDFDDLEPSEHAMFAAEPQPEQPSARMVPMALPEYEAEPWKTRSNVVVASNGDVCRVCGERPAGDAFLCAECVDDLSVNLGDIPSLLADLEVLTTRQARQTVARKKERAEHTRWDDALAADSSGVIPGRMLAAKGFNRVPYVPSASTTWHEIGNELTTTVRALCDARGLVVPKGDNAAASRWLLTHVQTLAIDVHGPDFARNLAKLHDRAMKIIDNAPEGIALGPCDSCKQAMHAEPDTREHSCENCGKVYDVADRLEARRNRIRESLLSLSEIAKFSADDRKTFGDRVTTKQLEGWVRRRRLLKAGARAGGPQGEVTLYRAGDVLNLVERRKAS